MDNVIRSPLCHIIIAAVICIGVDTIAKIGVENYVKVSKNLHE